MDEKEQQIIMLKQDNRCWDFFKIQKDHVLDSTKAIRKTISNINKNGYSEFSDLFIILKALDTIENQMPTNAKERRKLK